MPSMVKSVRLDAELARALKWLARQAGTTESEIIQKALRQYCAAGLGNGRGTLYERVRHLLGGFEGPGDLGRNARKYVLEAVDAKARRRRSR